MLKVSKRNYKLLKVNKPKIIKKIILIEKHLINKRAIKIKRDLIIIYKIINLKVKIRFHLIIQNHI